MRTRRLIGFRIATAIGLALYLGAGLTARPGTAPRQAQAAVFRPTTAPKWTVAWATSQNGLGMTALTNATVRMIARVTLTGDAVRLRLDNTYGTSAVTIGKAYVGHRVQREILAPGSNRPVTFSGAATATLPPGGRVESDPVLMPVIAGEDLAVSLYVPGADVRPSQHGDAFVTSYISDNGAGDVTADEVPPPPGSSVATRTPFKTTTRALFWLKAVDVRSTSSTGAIVAFGDSITDGTCSTIDGHDRWEDGLALRLDLAGAHIAVVNEGIAGNTLTSDLQPPPNSFPALERLDRDVLSHSGITHVILFEGTNDIRREASSAQVIAALQDIIMRVKARGLKMIVASIIPRHNYPAVGTNTGWQPAKSKIRHEVNEWIRTKAPVDGVLDFDRVIRDPANPEVNYPSFHCDGIHPSPHGYYELAKSIPLALFRARPGRSSSSR